MMCLGSYIWRKLLGFYDESCKLCSGRVIGRLSLASMIESVGGLRRSGLSCGEFHRFESIDFELMNLVDTKVYGFKSLKSQVLCLDHM